MKRLSTLFCALILLAVAPVLVLGQTVDCPTIVKTALDATGSVCSTVGRNQACYGNINLNVESQTNLATFTFSKPGDLVSVDGIKTLTLGPLDTKADTWGVALMKLQANLPDTLPGQNVTFVLFGDVQMDNAVDQIPTLDVTAKQTANVRQLPSKTAAIVASTKSGTAFIADGRSDDSSWLRIHSADLTLQGWVSTPLVKSSGDLQTLTSVSADAPRLNPMQAFYFKTGLNDAPCSAAPDSGILIQTPEGAGRISLTADDVQITLGSSAYIQAQASGEFTISVVEGEGTVTAAGTTVIVPAGTRVRVPLDNTLHANGVPVGPEPYDNARVAVLPVGLLADAITTTPALTVEAIATAIADIQPLSGKWLKPARTAQMTAECVGQSNKIKAVTFTVAVGPFDVAQMISTSTSHAVPATAYHVTREGNTYLVDYADAFFDDHYTIQVISPTLMQGTAVSNLKKHKGCVMTYSGSITYVGK